LNPRFRTFISYYRPYYSLLVADLVCAFVVATIVVLLPLCASYITGTLLENPNPDTLNQILLMGLFMIGLIAIHGICISFIDYQGHMMGAKMETDMRRDLFAHLQKLPFSFYDEQRTGQLMSRITNDLFNISELYHHGPEDIVLSIVKFFGTFIILASINLPLTLLVFLFLPIMATYALYFNRFLNRAMTRSRERIGDVNAQTEDTLAGIRVVKSFTNESLENQKFALANQSFLETRQDVYLNEVYIYNGTGAFIQLMTLTVVVFGGISILNATLTLAELLTFILCVGFLSQLIGTLMNFNRLYQEGITGFNRFIEIMEVQPEIQDLPDARPIQNIQGRIQFKDVTFKYKEEQQNVFTKLSLDIPAGEYVALVGASGVGKTTLCSLIPRFYEVSSGEILVDGNNISEITLASLRSNIGVVQQDVYLFAGTVIENIRYGKLNASDEEIMNAAKQANAHDFIMSLPNGYHTDIGQRGVKLSGGQKQRLSIARVFLKNPAILILDEATSSLDNESERAIQESLEKLTNNRTTLVIAHRLSTVRNAQRIVVLSENGINEQGTHEELIASNGVYAHLYNMQLSI
jgi:ATP-binding cassette, subfamily B, bacterial